MHLTFSADGKHSVYVEAPADETKRRIVYDGKPFPLPADLQFVALSPKGRHWACLAFVGESPLIEQRPAVLLVDGAKFPWKAGWVTEFTYDRPDQITARLGQAPRRHVSRVTQVILKEKPVAK